MFRDSFTDRDRVPARKKAAVMKVSVRQISEKTGFSPATVSNALNYKKGVNAETAEIVRKAARELGYYDAKSISRVKFVMYKRDGTIVEDTPFFPQMLRGIEEECRSLGYELTVQNLDRRDAAFEKHLQVLQNDKSAGVILLGTELLDEDIDLIHRIEAPLVLIDYWNEDLSFDAVMATNQDSTRTAVNYLIERGHTKIGYLQGSFRIKPFRGRAAGYLQALQKAGIPVDEKYQITLTANMDGAYTDMLKYLSQNPEAELPTAFFADNDVIALGAMKALREKGYRIPQDVSIIGFDDLSFSSISSPALTTMRVPKLELGRTAVRRIHDQVHDQDNVHFKTQVCTVFVERESVADLRDRNR